MPHTPTIPPVTDAMIDLREMKIAGDVKRLGLGPDWFADTAAEGWDADERGEPLTANPYPSDDPRAEPWSEGWHDAHSWRPEGGAQ